MPSRRLDEYSDGVVPVFVRRFPEPRKVYPDRAEYGRPESDARRVVWEFLDLPALKFLGRQLTANVFLVGNIGKISHLPD